MRNQRSDRVRQQMLRYRAEWPPHIRQVPAHIGTWDWLTDDEFCGCEHCRTYLCGVVAPSWRALEDRAATDRAWHITLIEEEPSAFEDEPLCASCLAALAEREGNRTRDRFVEAEWRELEPSGRLAVDDLRRSWPTL